MSHNNRDVISNIRLADNGPFPSDLQQTTYTRGIVASGIVLKIKSLFVFVSIHGSLVSDIDKIPPPFFQLKLLCVR